MQDSKIATTTCAGGGARREPVMNRTTTIRVSWHPLLLPSPPSLSPSAPVYGFVLRKLLHLGTLANPSSFFSDTGYRLVSCHPGWAPKFRSPRLHLTLLRDMFWKTRFHSYPIHCSSSSTCLFRSYLDFNSIYISFIRRAGAFESCVTHSRFWFS